MKPLYRIISAALAFILVSTFLLQDINYVYAQKSGAKPRNKVEILVKYKSSGKEEAVRTRVKGKGKGKLSKLRVM